MTFVSRLGALQDMETVEAESWSQTMGSRQSLGAHRCSRHGRELGVVPVAPSSLGTCVAVPGLCGPVE